MIDEVFYISICRSLGVIKFPLNSTFLNERYLCYFYGLYGGHVGAPHFPSRDNYFNYPYKVLEFWVKPFSR